MKAVLFDLDGVITDTAVYHYHAWKALGEKIGIEIDEEFNEELKGVSRTDSLNRILAKGNKEEAYSQTEKETMAAEKNELYKTMIEEMSPKDILPGIKALLDGLKERNILIGLASASQNGPTILEKLQLTDYFDEIVDPAKLKAGKPDPEIFLTGAKDLGVKPQDCVGVEDAAAGVEAIAAADMVSVGVGDADTLGKATKVVPETGALTVELLEEVWSEAVGRS
ncbi:MAG: beta-phosphoglucomutase [Desemzia incerta]|uniref:Beta-phosphoglucomutase n=1 Tax=Desemzia incerta TaxID=82801 RepID=A0A1I5XB19_9LACT|nr:beta-phosphoglucomutase [Desemzia incerta]SFQ28847.1 beta-phosphoglucomutase [Desemzia incerta]